MEPIATIDPSVDVQSNPAVLSRRGDNGVAPALLTVREVARLLNCSAKTIYRLNDRGAMPRPARLGILLRWPRATIESWIAEGCPAYRSGR